jgi:hypothetical protein
LMVTPHDVLDAIPVARSRSAAGTSCFQRNGKLHLHFKARAAPESCAHQVVSSKMRILHPALRVFFVKGRFPQRKTLSAKQADDSSTKNKTIQKNVAAIEGGAGPGEVSAACACRVAAFSRLSFRPRLGTP